MTTDLTAPRFICEHAAFDYLESVRWPDGPICPHCGVLAEPVPSAIRKAIQ